MRGYPPELIEDLRARCDIVDIISSYVQLRQQGSRFIGLCPFHREKSPSFSVSPQNQFYYCFGCGAGGNVIGFVMKIENYAFPDAVKHLAQRVNFTLPEPKQDENYRKSAAQKKILYEMHTSAARYYHEQLNSDKGAAARAYLAERRMHPRAIRKFGLGLAAGGLYQHLAHDYDNELLLKSGLVMQSEDGRFYDRFRRRLMFPIFDIQSRVIGFGGRIMGDGQPKYLNSSEGLLFDKSRVLYGLNLARKENPSEIILVEGYMDVIALHQAGFRNVAAAMGTAFNIQHARVLKNYCKSVVLLFDSDEAGERAVMRAGPILEAEGLHTKVLRLDGGKDPDEFLISQGAKAFAKALAGAVDFTKFQISQIKKRHDLNQPRERAAFAKAASAIIAKLPTAVERDAYTTDLAQSSGLDMSAVRQEVERHSEDAHLPDLPAASLTPRAMSFDVSPGCDEARRGILYLMAADRRLFERIITHLKAHELENPLYIQIFETIEDILSKRDIPMADILGHIEDEALHRSMAAVFALHIELDRPDLSNILLGYIRLIKDTHISNLISQAGDAGDMTRLMELTAEKAKLRHLEV